jgi:hypothetical protein
MLKIRGKALKIGGLLLRFPKVRRRVHSPRMVYLRPRLARNKFTLLVGRTSGRPAWHACH